MPISRRNSSRYHKDLIKLPRWINELTHTTCQSVTWTRRLGWSWFGTADLETEGSCYFCITDKLRMDTSNISTRGAMSPAKYKSANALSPWLTSAVSLLTYCYTTHKNCAAILPSIIIYKKAQLSLTNPRDAKAYQKLLEFDVLTCTTLSLTILVYLHSSSCWSVRNLRNPAKFSENWNLYSSRSSKVIDLGVNRKRICTFLLATNSNFGRISYRFRARK